VRRGSDRAADPALRDNWHGGFYELSLLLGAPDDGRLDRAVRALWSAAGLDGTGEVSAQAVLGGTLRTVADVPGIGRCVAAVMVVRVVDDGGRPVEDWLDLCLPLGSLSRRDRRVGAYPFADTASSRAWREPVEGWFAEVARAVHAVVAVRHAVTGHECSGTEVDEVGDGGWLGLLVPGEHGALVHHPVRRW
jgi:hypothetical protein